MTKPILIDETVARSVFKIRLPEHVKADDVVMAISRVGDTSDWGVIYPALSLDDDEVVFAWDDVLWHAPHGRYEGRLLVSGMSGCKMCVPFQIGSHCSLGQVSGVALSHNRCVGCGNG